MKKIKNCGDLSDKSMTSLYELYKLLKKYKTSNEFNEQFEIRIKDLIKNYAAEQNYVCFLFYKQGFKKGYENCEKLKQES